MNHYSNTQLGTYTSCNLAYKFQYIDKIVKPITSPNLVFGGAVHQALEYFHKNHKLTEEVTVKKLLDVFEFKWQSRVNDAKQPIIFTKNDSNAYFEVGADIMVKYHELKKDDNPPLIVLFDTPEGLGDMPAVEVPFEIPIDGIPPIIGYIDLISFNDNMAIVEDHKTGASTFDEFFIETDSQLTLYSAAFRQFLKNNRFVNPLTGNEYTNPVHTTRFNLFLKKMPTKKLPTGSAQIQLLPKKVSLGDINRVKAEIKMMHNGIQNGIFLPNRAKPYERHCSWCDYKEECRKYKIGE